MQLQNKYYSNTKNRSIKINFIFKKCGQTGNKVFPMNFFAYFDVGKPNPELLRGAGVCSPIIDLWFRYALASPAEEARNTEPVEQDRVSTLASTAVEQDRVTVKISRIQHYFLYTHTTYLSSFYFQSQFIQRLYNDNLQHLS